MLREAILLLAQIGAHRIKTLCMSGESNALKNIRPNTKGIIADFQEVLSKASAFWILHATKWPNTEQLVSDLLRHADDLDYLQTLITPRLGERSDINPSLNAVIDAHNRWKFRGRFKNQNQSVEFYTLLHNETKGPKDDDAKVLKAERRDLGFATSRLCYAFESDQCTFPNCRYRQACLLCESTSHGVVSCRKKEARQVTSQKQKTKPPHPRFRRDRAQDK